jgi:hypothetical protein
MVGFSVAAAELRDPTTLDAMTDALREHKIRLYDASYTIEAAAADLAAWAKEQGCRAALFIDSVHTASSDAGALAKTPRESVEANVRAIRRVATTHRLLVIGTAEANRAAFRTEDAAETTNDLSSGAETRTIEYVAQTLMMLRTPKGQPDIIHARVSKNRRALITEFWLRIDRDRHTVSECGNPAEDPHVVAKRSDEKIATNQDAVRRDAEAIADVVRHRPGIGEVELRAALRKAGHPMGVDRFNAAKFLLSEEGHNGVKLVNRGPHARSVKWHLETTEEHES